MDSLPNELIYKIAKRLIKDADIKSLAEVFPRLRFSLRSYIDYDREYHLLKDNFIITNLVWGNRDVKEIPRNIKNIKFREEFNKPIDHIPHSITSIVFGNKFNQPVDGLLPPELINLTFGFYFNYPITVFPHTLKRLCFNSKYNGSFNNLPKNLKHLKIFIIKPEQVIDNIPDSIEWLSIFCFCKVKIKKIPKNIKYLWIHKRNLLPHEKKRI